MKHISRRAAVVFGIGVAVAGVMGSIPQAVQALGWGNDMVVHRSEQVSGVDYDSCQGVRLSRAVVGDSQARPLCVRGGAALRFATYAVSTSHRVAISRGADSQFYQLRGICGSQESCVYVPAYDTLISKEYRINTQVRSLVVYRSVSQRLVRDTEDPLTVSYRFDTTAPDMVFQSGTGYAWPIGAVAVSDDDRYAAVEFRERGFGMLDLETLDMRRIWHYSYRYGGGLTPQMQLAVASGGAAVAVAGLNTGLHIITTPPECGDEPTDERMESVRPIAQPCVVFNPSTDDIIDRFRHAFNPYFSGGGRQLQLDAVSFTGEARRVVLRSAQYRGGDVTYLALGDSYTSGEGEIDDVYYLPLTNTESEKCHTSVRSYPFMVAMLAGVDSSVVRSVACSGARLRDVVGNGYQYRGQGDRLLTLAESPFELAYLQREALEHAVPGRVLQSAFVSQYTPYVATIGIGGNDAGLMQKLQACVMPGVCEWASSEGRAATRREIDDVGLHLEQAYRELRRQSPATRFHVVGYPQIIDPTGVCDTVTGYLLDVSERQFIAETIRYLNRVVASAAQRAEVGYIDIEAALAGSELCSESPVAINGLRLGDDISVVGRPGWLELLGNESFHPTVLGHGMIAQWIAARVDIILDVPRVPADIAPVSPYWAGDIRAVRSVQAAFVAGSLSDADSVLSLNLAPYILAPSTSFRVVIDGVVYLSGTTDEYGRVVGDVVWQSAEERSWVVAIEGVSASGESLRVYQTVSWHHTPLLPPTEPSEPPRLEEGGEGDSDSEVLPPPSPTDSSEGEPGDLDPLPTPPDTDTSVVPVAPALPVEADASPRVVGDPFALFAEPAAHRTAPSPARVAASPSRSHVVSTQEAVAKADGGGGDVLAAVSADYSAVLSDRRGDDMWWVFVVIIATTTTGGVAWWFTRWLRR